MLFAIRAPSWKHLILKLGSRFTSRKRIICEPRREILTSWRLVNLPVECRLCKAHQWCKVAKRLRTSSGSTIPSWIFSCCPADETWNLSESWLVLCFTVRRLAIDVAAPAKLQEELYVSLQNLEAVRSWCGFASAAVVLPPPHIARREVSSRGRKNTVLHPPHRLWRI